MNISIGADELILWLRKNGKAVNIGNQELGRKIKEVMDGLGAVLGNRNEPSLWALTFINDNLALPKTSQQYDLNIDSFPDLFRELSNW